MNATCSICLDTLGDQPEVPPMATRCGHLYCLTCATFHFASSDTTCAVCRTPHGLDALIKLYPNYTESAAGDGGGPSQLERGETRSRWTHDDRARTDLARITQRVLDLFRLLTAEGPEYSKTALSITLSRSGISQRCDRMTGGFAHSYQ